MFIFGGSMEPETYPFSNVQQVIITHNKGFKPFVYVITDAGEVGFCQITHNSDNQLTLSFQNSLSGVAFVR
jgi:hypothetical protein|tara:strand:+ start:74 stop:286 length:213 start_codon:yes stop_codon:yes gene_type:complete